NYFDNIYTESRTRKNIICIDCNILTNDGRELCAQPMGVTNSELGQEGSQIGKEDCQGHWTQCINNCTADYWTHVKMLLRKNREQGQGKTLFLHRKVCHHTGRPGYIG